MLSQINRSVKNDWLCIEMIGRGEGLAPIIVDQLASMVQNLVAEGVTILIAEQNVKFAMKVSSDCYILERGTIVHHQATNELTAETRKKYLGL